MSWLSVTDGDGYCRLGHGLVRDASRLMIIDNSRVMAYSPAGNRGASDLFASGPFGLIAYHMDGDFAIR